MRLNIGRDVAKANIRVGIEDVGFQLLARFIKKRPGHVPLTFDFFDLTTSGLGGLGNAQLAPDGQQRVDQVIH